MGEAHNLQDHRELGNPDATHHPLHTKLHAHYGSNRGYELSIRVSVWRNSGLSAQFLQASAFSKAIR